MPLQNRVDPFGAIQAVTDRGAVIGNRGILHRVDTKTLIKRWASKAWIYCLLSFRGRRREVMASRSWTELFFLDEVTALAAGHRPCFYCQRQRAMQFAHCWAGGNGGSSVKAGDMDVCLHAERGAVRGEWPAMRTDAVDGLPDGTMIAADGSVYAVLEGGLLPWAFQGYGQSMEFDQLNGKYIDVLTPRSVVETMRAGFVPVFHGSALHHA